MIYRSGFKYSIEASYRFDEEIRPLKTDSDLSLSFDDPNDIWSIEEHGIILDVLCEWKKPNIIFSECVVPSDGVVLGLAVRLQSPESRQRLIFTDDKSISITSLTEKTTIPFSLSIKPGILRVSAILEIILYVKSNTNDSYSAEPGTVLCETGWEDMSFSGDSSLFPITTYPLGKNNVLWSLSVNCNDPRIDPFFESVELKINEDNKHFSKLDLDRAPMENPVFQEILAQTIFLLISKLKSDYPDAFPDIESGENLEYGSLGAAVNYMIITFAHNENDPIALSREIHSFIERGGVPNDDVD